MKLPTSSFHRLWVTRRLIGPVTSWLPADITRPPRHAISLSAVISPLGHAWPWDQWDHWDGFGMASEVQPLAQQSNCVNKPYLSSFLRAVKNDAHPETMTTETRPKVFYSITLRKSRSSGLTFSSTIQMIDTIKLGTICKEKVLVSRAIIQFSGQVQFY